MTQRETAVLLERARVRTKGKRVVFDLAQDGVEKSFNIPFANIATVFLGQGCSITTEAARNLSEEGVFVSITGTGGTPVHFGSMNAFEPNEYAWRMFRIASDPNIALATARLIMEHRCEVMSNDAVAIATELSLDLDAPTLRAACARFRGAVQKASSGSALMGMEGRFASECYKIFARAGGLEQFSRSQGQKSDASREDAINGRIDHGNYLAYGTCSAALWAMGIHRGLSVLHGKTRNGGLVLDLADAFKDGLVLPYAFASWDRDQKFRNHLIDALHDREVLKKMFVLLKRILELDPGGSA